MNDDIDRCRVMMKDGKYNECVLILNNLLSDLSTLSQANPSRTHLQLVNNLCLCHYQLGEDEQLIRESGRVEIDKMEGVE